ncbi:MAG TPA: hypothetical protein VG320_12505 [Paraburkholderia sp.]|jgi:hypothetical protein|uniref:hypothetical protein n=1 Tax=Paraburkholderia sp. TaxID=1926495 RepID=UPI002DE24B09|nr:hypothetical protein [Paraburkholderia sp.]
MPIQHISVDIPTQPIASETLHGDAATEAPGVAEIVAVMKAGVRYSARELGKLLGVRAPVINEILVQALKSGALREAGRSSDNRYWVPSAEQLAQEARLRQRYWWCQAPLTGYEQERREFRNLCMLARR